MNKIYKLIWSKVKKCWVVVSELAKSHTKTSDSNVVSQIVIGGMLCSFLSVCSFVKPIYANVEYLSNVYISQNIDSNVKSNSANFINSYPTYDSYQLKLATDYNLSFESFSTAVSDIYTIVTNFKKDSCYNSDFRSVCEDILNPTSYSSFKSATSSLKTTFNAYNNVMINPYAKYVDSLNIAYDNLTNYYTPLSSVVKKIGGTAISDDDLLFKRVALDYSTAMSTYQTNLTAYNNLAKAFGENSIAIGKSSIVNGNNSIALGNSNEVNGNNSGAFGDPSVINADESYVLGNNNTINTGATGSFIVGNDSVSSAKAGLIFGSNNELTANAENSIALGNNIVVSGQNSIALGSGSIARGNYGSTVAIGDNSQSLKNYAVAIGRGSYSFGDSSLSLGYNSKAYGFGSISIGNALSGLKSTDSNDIPTNFNIAIGEDAKAYGIGSISLGENSLSYNSYSVAVGKDAHSTSQYASAFGYNSRAYGPCSVAIGGGSAADSAISLGHLSEASGNSSISLGTQSKAYGVHSLAIAGGLAGKPYATSTSTPTNYNIAVGGDSIASKAYSTALGNHAIASGEASTALGYDSNSVGSSSIALGRASQAFGTFSVALGGGKAGNQADSPTGYNVALGFNATASYDGSVALGSYSVVNEANSVSVGNSALQRKITYVKAGKLSASSTDAVNGAQLYAMNQNIAGFSNDITRNKNNIRELNTSVSAALSSVSSTSDLVNTLNNIKADTSLNNLTAMGRQVIATAAATAVQEYMANQQGSAVNSVAPMAYNLNTVPVTDAGNGSLSVGNGSIVNGTSSIAIGVGNQVNANNAGAFGDPSIINADESYVLGNDDTINTGATASFIVGNDSVSNAKGSLLFGSNSNTEATAENGVGLGNQATVFGKNSVALGYQSTAMEDNVVSVGNDSLKRRITNIADGTLSSDSTDAVIGKQLYATNEKVEENKLAIAQKADRDASNINTVVWADKLGTGKVEENDSNLVTGDTVFNAISAMEQNNPVQATNDGIFIGANQTDNVISIYNKNGEGRVITGVMTNPKDTSSAANVGYVNAVGESIMGAVNNSLGQLDTKVNKVGANAAAMASLTPASFEGDEKWSLSAGVGNYKGETAGAVGAFYRPAENVLMNVRGSFGNNENMVGAAVSVSLSKGDVPGVTKRQLANTVNRQANAINQLQQNQVQYENKIAEQNDRINEQDRQIKELMKRLEAVEKR